MAAYVFCPTCEKIVYAKEVIQSDINDDGEPINPTATLYCTECLSWLASTTMPGNFVGLN